MSVRAHIREDWERNQLRIAVALDDAAHGPRRLLSFGPVGVMTVDAEQQIPDDDYRLDLPDEVARAIYEALADHFGHSGHDTRALRRDYEAERKRVDTFIAHITKAALTPPP